jgi:YebC/PmpR family DNA-binding regulatory protein
MSGHSKWSTIKHKKAINDAKKGKIFSKVSVQITHAAKQGGGDPNMNPSLRMYIDKAKEVGFPQDKIEKAIQKGTGEGGDGVVYDDSSYEGFGPYGIQIVVDTLTDNKNRTVADLRKLFEDIGGTMGETGSVGWNFDIKGLIVIKPGHMEESEKFGEDPKYVEADLEEVLLTLMDIDGVLDIQEVDLDGTKGLEIYTEYNQLASVKDAINELGYVLKEADLIKEAKMEKELNTDQIEKVQSALESLEDNDDVQNVWTDAKF